MVDCVRSLLTPPTIGKERESDGDDDDDAGKLFFLNESHRDH